MKKHAKLCTLEAPPASGIATAAACLPAPSGLVTVDVVAAMPPAAAPSTAIRPSPLPAGPPRITAAIGPADEDAEDTRDVAHELVLIVLVIVGCPSVVGLGGELVGEGVAIRGAMGVGTAPAARVAAAAP